MKVIATRGFASLIISAAVAVVMAAAAPLVFAGTTDEQAALEAGAERLTSDQIAERFVGQTVTFVSASGDKTFLIHYGEDNNVAGRMVGGGWSDTGYYAVANDDSICLSWNGSDKGRLRCMTVLVVDGVVKKYKADGSLSGSIVAFETGKAF